MAIWFQFLNPELARLPVWCHPFAGSQGFQVFTEALFVLRMRRERNPRKKQPYRDDSLVANRSSFRAKNSVRQFSLNDSRTDHQDDVAICFAIRPHRVIYFALFKSKWIGLVSIPGCYCGKTRMIKTWSIRWLFQYVIVLFFLVLISIFFWDIHKDEKIVSFIGKGLCLLPLFYLPLPNSVETVCFCDGIVEMNWRTRLVTTQPIFTTVYTEPNQNSLPLNPKTTTVL